MNPLEPYPGARKALYLVQFVVAGVILLFGVAFAAADMDFPKWYVVGSAVASALWSYLGLQAAANTNTKDTARHLGSARIEVLPDMTKFQAAIDKAIAEVEGGTRRNERGHAAVSLFLSAACLVLLIVVLVRVL